jgi:predicted transcriptional regulator
MTASSFIAWRGRLRLSVTAASSALGCSRRAIQSWEMGRTKIPHYIALACQAIANGLPPMT